jgi:hypothetical protein
MIRDHMTHRVGKTLNQAKNCVRDPNSNIALHPRSHPTKILLMRIYRCITVPLTTQWYAAGFVRTDEWPPHIARPTASLHLSGQAGQRQ